MGRYSGSTVGAELVLCFALWQYKQYIRASFRLATWKSTVCLKLPKILPLPACVALSLPLSASGYYLSQVVGF